MRSVLRALGALPVVLLAAPGLALTVPSGPALAADTQPAAARTQAAGAGSVSISITAMTPQYATADSTVTVDGTLANRTGSAVSGINVQAESSPANFSGRSEMSAFTSSGSYPSSLDVAGTPFVTGTVRSGATVRWSVSFPAKSFYDTFGVYPVQVLAETAGGTPLATARTFLPYWTGGAAASQPDKLQVAWIWPLIDTPQQGACGQTLASNGLAASVAGGRLSTLLGAGADWSQADDLTWDIDPALLSDVSVMTHKYDTGGDALCSDRSEQQASPAAAKWLAQLQTGIAGQAAFLTPYADVDVAALSHAGLDASVRSAYQLGETVAGQILPGTFGTGGTALKAAWPAGGEADAEVLTDLANDGGIRTVVLNSDELSSATAGYDNALAGRTTSGMGTSMSVLLADAGLTSLLGAATAKPTETSQFALTQDFLAQTAMISSEAPNLARSLLIAPPTGWNPSPSEAAALLRLTHDAPWLHPVGMSALAAQAAKVRAAPVQAKQVSHSELSASYLDRLKAVDANLSLFTNLLYQPSNDTLDALEGAAATTESAAWRGGKPGGQQALANLSGYLNNAERQVQIIYSKKILLTGNSGETPVSVRNGLGWPVQVRVTASTPAGSQLRVERFAGLLTVQARKTNTVRMPLHADTIGTSTVQLQLVTENGSPMTWTAKSLSVEVTRVGRFLLTIIGGALGILVLTSAYRLRRKRRARAGTPGREETVNAGGAG